MRATLRLVEKVYEEMKPVRISAMVALLGLAAACVTAPEAPAPTDPVGIAELKVTQLETRLAKAEKDLASAREEVVEARERVKRAENRLADARGEVTAAETRVEQAKTALNNARVDLGDELRATGVKGSDET